MVSDKWIIFLRVSGDWDRGYILQVKWVMGDKNKELSLFMDGDRSQQAIGVNIVIIVLNF